MVRPAISYHTGTIGGPIKEILKQQFPFYVLYTFAQHFAKGQFPPLADAGFLLRAGAEQVRCMLTDTAFWGEHEATHSTCFSLLVSCSCTSRHTDMGHLLGKSLLTGQDGSPARSTHMT